jgi:general secretion pathway protein B
MSYILDALRRADAERERGAVPGLHAQPDVSDLEPAARDRRQLLYAVVGVGGLLVAVVSILLAAPWRHAPTDDARLAAAGDTAVEPRAPVSPAAGARPAPAPAAATPAAVPAATLGTPAPAAADATGAALAASTTSIATLAPDGSVQHTVIPAATGATGGEERGTVHGPATAAAPTERAPAARGAGPEARAVAMSRANPAPPNGGGAASARGAAVGQADTNGAPATDARPAATQPEVVEHYGPPLPGKAAPAAPAPAPVVKNVNDLPAPLRAQLPRLAVGGAIYSDTPSGRMLILNGQVYHEGDHPTPDTLIEQIRLKSAVLNFRGTRYEITY